MVPSYGESRNRGEANRVKVNDTAPGVRAGLVRKFEVNDSSCPFHSQGLRTPLTEETRSWGAANYCYGKGERDTDSTCVQRR